MGIITVKEVKDVIGISDNERSDQTRPTNRPSTLPHYRPGNPYFYPAFKIHKMKKEDLIPGAIYLLIDNRDTLVWLNNINDEA